MNRNKAHDVATYAFAAGDRFLLDANIWIYLLPPPAKPTPAFAQNYGGVLKAMLAANVDLVVESLVLSEYLNRYWRIELSAWQKANPVLARQFNHFKTGQFLEKQFRLSPHFKAIGAAARAEAQQILKLCRATETPLQLNDLPAILSEFEAGNLDFNDGVLVDTCRLRGWKMVTHDKDMTLGGIEVVTANPNLLAACP